MSQETCAFNLDSERDMTHDYRCKDIKYAYIADANNGNYTNGLIQFNSTSMFGSEVSTPFEISQAYVQIPFQWSALITNGTWNDATNLQPDNINAVCCKGYHHLIHQSWAQFGQVNVNNSATQYWNLYMNENFKKQTQEELLKDGEITNFHLDNAASYNYNSAIGEFNNNTMGGLLPAIPANISTLIGNLMTGNIPENDAIAKRNATFIDSISPLGSALASGASTFGNVFQPYFVNATGTLTWYDMATIRLADLLPFFKECPSVSKLDGFSLKIQTNLASSNTWTVSYNLASALTGAQYALPNGITTTQSVGTCPFMISSIFHPAGSGAGNTGGSNAVAKFTSQTLGTVKISCQIGWGAGANAPSFPCRIYIPAVTYSGDTLTSILRNPEMKLLCNDMYLDTTIQGVQGQYQVSRPIPIALSRPRKIYILPFLSTQNVCATGTTTLAPLTAALNMISPLVSPLSSAPTTTSKCTLRNFNIMIGGKSLFPVEMQSYNNHFYENSAYPLMSQENGNAVKSLYKSGAIKKSDFFKCYNTYVVDLKRVEFIAEDDPLKSLVVNWFVDAPQAVKYDFYLLLEYEKEFTINRFSGIVVKNSNYD
jgi:hypothetical protein